MTPAVSDIAASHIELALEAAGIGTWQFWPDDDRVQWDARGEKIYGVSGACSTEDLYTLHNPADHGIVKSSLDALSRGEPVLFRLRARRRNDGEERWLEVSGRAVDAVEDDSPIVGTVRDIHDDINVRRQLDTAETRLRLALDAAKVGVFEYDFAKDRYKWDDVGHAVFGTKDESLISIGDLEKMIDPADHPAFVASFNAAIDPDIPGRQRVEFRTRRTPFSDPNWVSMVGQVFYAGRTPTYMIGCLQDITPQKNHADALHFAARELNHRVRNMFALMQTIIRVKARESDSIEAFSASMLEKVKALSIAQSLGMPNGQIIEAMSIRTLVGTCIAAHQPDSEKRLELSAPEMIVVPEATVTPLSMIVHELATNAEKHGAWSEGFGTVKISWSRTTSDDGDAMIKFVWEETNSMTAPDNKTDMSGFGSRLMTASARQLGGKINRRWTASGVEVILTYPDRLASSRT